MKCPYCAHDRTKVTDKRQTKDLAVIRRRRECLKCKKRFTTHEKLAQLDIVVIKKSGKKEPYKREKIEAGFLKACKKRPIAPDKIQHIINQIENKLKQQKSHEIKSEFIGELVMKKLKSLDEIAYMRFASVYKDFGDLKDFKKELKKL